MSGSGNYNWLSTEYFLSVFQLNLAITLAAETQLVNPAPDPKKTHNHNF